MDILTILVTLMICMTLLFASIYFLLLTRQIYRAFMI